MFPREELFAQLGDKPGLRTVGGVVQLLGQVVLKRLGEQEAVLDLRLRFGDRHRGSEHLLDGLGKWLSPHAGHHFAEQSLQPLRLLREHLDLRVLRCLEGLVLCLAHCLLQILREFVDLLGPLEALAVVLSDQVFILALKSADEPLSVQVPGVDRAQLGLESLDLLGGFEFRRRQVNERLRHNVAHPVQVLQRLQHITYSVHIEMDLFPCVEVGRFGCIREVFLVMQSLLSAPDPEQVHQAVRDLGPRVHALQPPSHLPAHLLHVLFDVCHRLVQSLFNHARVCDARSQLSILPVCLGEVVSFLVQSALERGEVRTEGAVVLLLQLKLVFYFFTLFLQGKDVALGLDALTTELRVLVHDSLFFALQPLDQFESVVRLDLPVLKFGFAVP